MVIKQYIKKLLKTMGLYEVYVECVPLSCGEILKDKVALITGASSGIGLGIAETFVNQGAFVIITGRNEEKLKAAVKKFPDKMAYMIWDAMDIEVIKDNFFKCLEIFGRIDILVNNAGYHGNQNFLSISETDYDNTFNVNMKNVFFMSQCMAKYMIEENVKGNILNISSASSMKPAWSPYEITKWGVRGFTRGLARELAPYGIVVNGIAPGPCATEMSHYRAGNSIAFPSIPSGRMALPQEIGNLAAFLTSDYGKLMLGETIFCDGGSGLLTVNK